MPKHRYSSTLRVAIALLFTIPGYCKKDVFTRTSVWCSRYTCRGCEHQGEACRQTSGITRCPAKRQGTPLIKEVYKGFVDKAPDEAVEKTYVEYVQRELHEKEEKTIQALSSHAISVYANVVRNVVQLDSAEGMRKDIEEDPIIKRIPWTTLSWKEDVKEVDEEEDDECDINKVEQLWNIFKSRPDH